MSVKLRAALDAVQKFYHEVEVDSDKVVQRVEDMHARRKTVFSGTHKQLDGAMKNLDEVESLMSDLEQSNGGPTLDGSSESSEPQHPQASWGGQK